MATYDTINAFKVLQANDLVNVIKFWCDALWINNIHYFVQTSFFIT